MKPISTVHKELTKDETIIPLYTQQQLQEAIKGADQEMRDSPIGFPAETMRIIQKWFNPTYCEKPVFDYSCAPSTSFSDADDDDFDCAILCDDDEEEEYIPLEKLQPYCKVCRVYHKHYE